MKADSPTRSRVQQVRDQLEDDIVNGRMRPGEQVQIEMQASRQNFFRERHAHGIGNTLAKRPRCGFDPQFRFVFGMPRCARTQLAEIPELVDAERITSQVQ